MWKMLDPDIDCDECGGPGPPPEFLIPPPPRPPFMHELANKCSEDPIPDIEMCEAIPTIDASYVSSPSFQASAILVLCTVLLVLIILISSLFVWKHKRKVQNFLPCKTPTRGPLDGANTNHSVTYEDPDAHLGHRPLVVRHHNMEMLHPKTLHYPSGYPMTRSPPLFICSSPGPDPYRSHDNVYEELEQRQHRDTDSERAHVSDDDFAEDELSLPGERSFQKSSPDATTVATIYQERSNSSSNGAVTDPGGNGGGSSSGEAYIERNRTERNSLLSSSSSGNDNQSTSVRPIRNSNSSSDCGGSNSLGLSLFRCSRSSSSSGNNNSNNNNNNNNNSVNTKSSSRKPNVHAASVDELHVTEQGTDIPPVIYDDRSLLSLPPSYCSTVNNNLVNNNVVDPVNSGLVHSNSSNNNSSSATNNQLRTNFYASSVVTDDEVERRNRINSQMSQHPVATIFREHGQRPHHHHYQRTAPRNPRSLDRRRFVNPPAYYEPGFHEGVLYDYATTDHHHRPPPQYPYILPEFTTFRLPPNGTPTAVYSRDSSFGSDSGYSQHTHNSGRSMPGWGGRTRQKEQSIHNNSTFEGS